MFQTKGDVQGCDGKKAKKSEFKNRGVHFKMKRVRRKVFKAIYKITRRKTASEKKKGKNNNPLKQ